MGIQPPCPLQPYHASEFFDGVHGDLASVTSDSFWTACALVLVIEGLLPFLSPHDWRRAMTHLAQLPDNQLRFFALLAIIAGLAMLWF